MTLSQWGRGLLIWGMFAVLAAVAPTLLLSLLPPDMLSGVVELIAILLLFSVLPLAAVVASAGALLLLVAVLRRRDS